MSCSDTAYFCSKLKIENNKKLLFMHRLLFICLLMLFIGAGSKKKKCKHNSNNLYPNADLVKKKNVINVLTIFFHFPSKWG